MADVKTPAKLNVGQRLIDLTQKLKTATTPGSPAPPLKPPGKPSP
jgi:hypothetical protein